MVYPAILSTLTPLSVFLHSKGVAAKIILGKAGGSVSLKEVYFIRQFQTQKSGAVTVGGEMSSPSPAETLVGLFDNMQISLWLQGWQVPLFMGMQLGWYF